MNRALLVVVLVASMLTAGVVGSGGTLTSRYAAKDVEPTADPATAFWQDAVVTVATNDRWGHAIPGHRTEIRSRWTDQHLYFLFVCPYEELYLRPNPSTTTETNKLWEWDVAEVFIGSDFENIRQYKEFQVSPQGEWVDLDIDLDTPKPEGGWRWDSGFRVAARIDRNEKVWYGEMRIPRAAIDSRPATPGSEMRINVYRIQGPPAGEDGSSRIVLSWQPTHDRSNHVPESFGRIRLVR